jgi:hypothetical protein
MRNTILLCSFLSRLHWGQIEGIRQLPPKVAKSVLDLLKVLGTTSGG